jgi:hypothetical protein
MWSGSSTCRSGIIFCANLLHHIGIKNVADVEYFYQLTRRANFWCGTKRT